MRRRPRAGHVSSSGGGVAVASVEDVPLRDLAKELDTYSSAISTQLRTVNLGVLGLAWLLLLRNRDVAAVAERIAQRPLLAIASGCLAALVCDLAQYLFGEKVVDKAYDAAAASSTGAAPYDETSFAYRAQLFCYHAKVVLTLVTAIGCVALVLLALW